MNVLKKMRVVDYKNKKLILEDAKGYLYILEDTLPEQQKYPPVGKELVAVNYRNKKDIRFCKHMIGNLNVVEWAEAYLIDNTAYIDEAYKLLLPVYFKYSVFKRWLRNHYSKDEFSRANKTQLLKYLAEFIIERYGNNI